MASDDTALWDDLRRIIRSRSGGWRVGEDVFIHGRGLFADLLGRASWFQLLVLNMTGRLPERRLADWLEGTFMCLSWPDARIWCNQIATYAGALRTPPTAAASAGIMASESRLYGPGTALASGAFIIDAQHAFERGAAPAEIISAYCKRKRTRAIPGFARPVAKGDERVAAMRRYAAALGFTVGKHMTVANAVEQELFISTGESMNLAGYITAFLSDQGFTPAEIHALYAVCVESGLLACYREAVANPPDSFLPLRVDDINYIGPPPRAWDTEE